jgi:hypothetical protein
VTSAPTAGSGFADEFIEEGVFAIVGGPDSKIVAAGDAALVWNGADVTRVGCWFGIVPQIATAQGSLNRANKANRQNHGRTES